MVAQQPDTPTQSDVLLSGIVPPLADTYYTRTETGPDLLNTLHPGETAVLVHGEESNAAPVTQGGTGKTQVAAQFAMALLGAAAVEILVWVTGAASVSSPWVSTTVSPANRLDVRSVPLSVRSKYGSASGGIMPDTSTWVGGGVPARCATTLSASP